LSQVIFFWAHFEVGSSWVDPPERVSRGELTRVGWVGPFDSFSGLG